MRNSVLRPVSGWRHLAQACVVVSGLVSIVGSGGGDGCFYYSGPDCGFGLEPLQPTIEPSTVALQVGGTAEFSVRAPGITEPTYQWSRAPKGGAWVAIPGATGATYALAGANLADDGASFMATVQGGFDGKHVAADSLPARLAVSSMPSVVFHDSEFALADWPVVAISEPLSNGPAHVEAQATIGGNPGAYRESTFTMPPGPGRLALFHTFAPAIYDPGLQGPVYLIEFTLDCRLLPGVLGSGPTLLIEQQGRRYTAGGLTWCISSAWSNPTLLPGTFRAADFVQVDGPACIAGDPCPDFTAAGEPIHFGFMDRKYGSAGFAGGSGGFGVDNWKVTVWRR